MTTRISEEDHEKKENGSLLYKISLEEKYRSEKGTSSTVASASAGLPSSSDHGVGTTRAAQHWSQFMHKNFTGARIDMTGEILTTSTSEQAITNNSGATVDAYKESSNSTISYEEEGRKDVESIEIEIPYGTSLQAAKKKKPIFNYIRVWKHQGRLVVLFAIISAIFIFLSLWSRHQSSGRY